MSLTKAVKFRFLAAQLTQAETIQFVSKLLNDNINIIISALFQQILSISSNQQSEGDTIINIISNIILSRKKKPKPIGTQNIKLDQLPKKLIGVISSFLHQYENINFGKTNRFIYLGCNSPNLLQELNLQGVRDCASINLRLFPAIKHFSLTLTQCNKLFLPPMTGLSVMNELESIEFVADYDILKFDGSHTDFDDVFPSNYINITKLTCTRFGTGTEFVNTAAMSSEDKFMKLLKKFPNVQYLHLYDFYVNINVNKIKDLYPNLKGLAVNCPYEDTNRDLVTKFGNNLAFLELTNFHCNFKNTNFGQLEELILNRASIKPINDILQTAKNLKKICIFSRSLITPIEMKGAMAKFIKACKSLEYIEFRDHDAELLGSALDGIGEGLFETKHLKRNKIKIRVVMYCNNHQFDPKDFLLHIEKIVERLNCSRINDFMFILKFQNLSHKIEKKLLQELKSKCAATNVVVFRFGIYFVTKNNDCKI